MNNQRDLQKALNQLAYFKRKDKITDLFPSEVVNSQVKLVNICIDSISKQIKKKPKKRIVNIQNPSDDFDEFYCPNCKYYLTSEYEEEYTEYCYQCGQHLDWSEE